MNSEILILELDSSKRKCECTNCSKEFGHGDIIIKYTEYELNESDWEDDYYEDYEYMFCNKKCMIDYLIKNSDNLKRFKIEEFNSKSEENSNKIKSIERILENIKPNENIDLYDFKILCFDNSGYIRYVVNDTYIRTLSDLKAYVMRNLKLKKIIY